MRQTPAVHAITRTNADGSTATIYACPDHLAATIAQLRAAGARLSAGKADPSVHGCKGCCARWAPMRRTGA